MRELIGVVCRVRVNPPESDREPVEGEYVAIQVQGELALSDAPELEWTTDRTAALRLPWESAQQLASEIGFPAHVVVIGAGVNSAEESARDMQPARDAVRTAIPGRNPVPELARHARGGSRSRWRITHVEPSRAYEINEKSGCA